MSKTRVICKNPLQVKLFKDQKSKMPKVLEAIKKQYPEESKHQVNQQTAVRKAFDMLLDDLDLRA